MATASAIAAVTRGILGLLEDGYPRSFGALAFAPMQLSDVGREQVAPRGFTLCLYHVVVNSAARNALPRPTPGGASTRPSVPLDLHYLLTPWSRDVDDQQQLLGWALRYLADNAVLPAERLNRAHEGAAIFRADETVQLVFEPLPLGDMAAVLRTLQPNLQTSLSLVARNVVLDSEPVAEGGS